MHRLTHQRHIHNRVLVLERLVGGLLFTGPIVSIVIGYLHDKHDHSQNASPPARPQPNAVFLGCISKLSPQKENLQ